MHTPVISLLVLLTAVGLPTGGHAQEAHKDCFNLSEPGHYPDYERLPRYSIVRHDYDISKSPVLLLRVNVPSRGLFGASIIRLGCKLASEFPKERAIQALIFDDKKAARNLALNFTDQTDYGIYSWHLKARFELNRETGQAFVEYLLPEVQDDLLSPKRFRVSLSFGDTPTR